VQAPVRSGRQALRLGIVEGTDLFSYSSAEQTVTIPAHVASARLSFWIHGVTAATSRDVQYVLLFDRPDHYRTLLWRLASDEGWQPYEFSLDEYRGREVTLRFGVRNDGDGARTAMFVDDVSLELCGEE